MKGEDVNNNNILYLVTIKSGTSAPWLAVNCQKSFVTQKGKH